MKNACLQILILLVLLSGHGLCCAQAAWETSEPAVSEPAVLPVFAAAPTLAPAPNTPNPAATFIPSSTVEIPELNVAQLAIPLSLMTYGMFEAAMTPNFKLLNYAAHNAVDIYISRAK